MSRIGTLADIHLGNHQVLHGPIVAGLNRRCRLTLQCLRCAVERANDERCSHLIIAGDLFDDDCPSPQLIAAAIDVLREFSGKVIIMLGNHDQSSTQVDDHALAPLSRAGFTVITTPAVEYLESGALPLLLIPFRPVALMAGYLVETRESFPRDMGLSALIGHCGIYDQTFPDYLKGKSAVSIEVVETLAEKYQIATSMFGDYHTHKRWRRGARETIQIGALCPADFGNKAPFGGLLVLDTETNEVVQHEIPGPRFVNMTWTGRGEEPLDIEDDWPNGHQVHVRVRAKPQQIAKATAWMVEVVEAVSKDIVAWEVEPDTADAEEAAKEAAARPLSLDMRRDLTEYVAGRPEIPERLRERVVSATLDRLRTR